MTKRRDFKALVRARMAATGEKYTVALRAIETQGPGVDFDGIEREGPEAAPEARKVGNVEVITLRGSRTTNESEDR